MSSGVKVSDNCVTAFEALKLNKAYEGKKMRYIIYKISDDKTHIEIDKTQEKTPIDKAAPTKFYDDFAALLASDYATQPRYIIFDFEYVLDDGRPQNKVTLLNWCPDNAGVKLKMLYASSKDAIKQKCNGIAKEHQGTELSEMDYASVLERCKA